MDRGSGLSPECQPPVPHESTITSNPASLTFCWSSPSAIGDLQMFPRQTMSTLYDIFHGVCLTCLSDNVRQSSVYPSRKNIINKSYKIEEVQKPGNIVGVDKTIIMAALNITHEFLNHDVTSSVHIVDYKKKITNLTSLVDQALES